MDERALALGDGGQVAMRIGRHQHLDDTRVIEPLLEHDRALPGARL